MKRTLRRGVMALLLLAAAQAPALAQPLDGIRYADDSLPLRGWVSAEYLAWWMRGQQTGPLVVSNSSSDPFLSNPDTVVLLGDDRIHHRAASGLRFTIGTWCNAEAVTGVEFSAFYLQPRHTQFVAASDANGSPGIALAYPLAPDFGDG